MREEERGKDELDEKENDRERKARIAVTYLPVRYIKNAMSFNAGVSHGENLAAIRHRYPRIRDYVRSVRDYHRHEGALGLPAAHQRRPGSREFRG